MTKFIEDYPTYATVEEADKYLKMKYGSIWDSKDETSKKQLLITATRQIDMRQYAGAKKDPEQPLQFPRIFLNGSVSDDELLTNTAIELADALSTQGISTTDQSTVNAIDSYQVGDTKVTFKDDVEIKITGIDDIINDMLAAYLSDKGMRIWL